MSTPLRMFIEFQWDEDKGKIRMQAADGYGGPGTSYNRVTRPATTLEQAQEHAKQFVHLYRYCGATVVTETQELAPYPFTETGERVLPRSQR